MLTPETKRKIDNCRDTLVGKIPVPMSQIEQITLALTYKFMSDIDEENRELGWASFFEWDFEKYAWKNIMDKRNGAQERLNLYSEGLDSMSRNGNIPDLFRDIFRNAYLPFKDPTTLDRFLKQIDEFHYEHSEELGNAFEYLLSTAGSQGDAGQFRTPRHIIDFLVSIVEPTKDDTILDPACGTAGFLISAYKHILEQNGKNLSIEDKQRISRNISGYDISHDMVRLSLVNMYLHNFADPKIYEYDTLSSEERWYDDFDCILANPPFMTPKGGSQPHKRFSITSTKSEVLFVDYIMEHMKIHGKAGIIVPEGVIFQSGKAYKELRENMVKNNFLWAVVSLPSGVFQPYSGVKTSILFFDRQLAKKTDKVLFVKVSADGYDLGAQRRPINKNDLPEAFEVLKRYKESIKKDGHPELVSGSLAHLVDKTQIAEWGEYSLSGERYKVIGILGQSNWDMVKLWDIVDIKTGKKDVNEWNPDWEYPFFTCAKDHTFSNAYSFDTEALLIAWNGDVWAVKYYKWKFEAYQRTYVLSNFQNVLPRYLFQILNAKLKETVSAQKLGNTMPYIKLGMLTDFEIPLPPLEIQEQIVAELDGYQRIIDGARAVVENYKPMIRIDPEWEMVELGEIARVINWKAYKQEELLSSWKYPVLRVWNFFSNRDWYYSDLELDSDKYCDYWDLLYAWSASFWPRIWKWWKTIYHYHIWKIVPSELIDRVFLSHILEKETENLKSEWWRWIAMMHLTKENFEKKKIPLPPLEIQQSIVEQIEEEQRLVDANRRLIEIYEGKIREKMDEVWGVK